MLKYKGFKFQMVARNIHKNNYRPEETTTCKLKKVVSKPAPSDNICFLVWLPEPSNSQFRN